MSHMHGRVSKARTMRGGPWSGGGVLIFMPVSARGTEQGGSLPLSGLSFDIFSFYKLFYMVYISQKEAPPPFSNMASHSTISFKEILSLTSSQR